MCGVAAIVGPGFDPEAIFTMTRVQAHRGPDDHGHLFVGSEGTEFVHGPEGPRRAGACRVVLGHRRLSILDCSAEARQPMSLSDGRDWISYNGEVYNFVELRSELKERGHRFRTTGDTEVVLAAYREWGTDCFARFNGMWAILIWDDRAGQLIVSRDRFGIKPLHFAQEANSVFFASEIKAILEASDVPRTANLDAVMRYLKFSLVNQDESTFFANVHAFPPAHFARIDPDAPWPMKPVRFWDYGEPVAGHVERKEADDRLRELFADAVRIRTRSDVPVGSCLSGGLDSSSIVALAAEGRSGEFHTFTSIFDDVRFDERKWANLVSEQMGTVSHTVMPDQATFLEDLDLLTWHQEEPFTSASIFAQWCIMREARRTGIPVLLDGQGADEVLCGYRKFTVFHLRNLARSGQFARLAREVAGLLRHGDRGLLNLADASRYLPSWMRDRQGTRDSAHYLKPASAQRYASTKDTLGTASTIGERQRLDIARFSVPSLLRYEDRNSMAFSIESRVPFLDYRLVDWAVNLPAHLKITDGWTKAILRRAMKGTLPDEIVFRRDKMGFVTPQKVWIEEALGRRMEQCFSQPGRRIEALADRQALLRDVRAYAAEDRTISDGVLFRFFMLDTWMERFDVRV